VPIALVGCSLSTRRPARPFRTGGPVGIVRIGKEWGVVCGVRQRVTAGKAALLREVVPWTPWQTNAVGGNAELFAM